MQVWYAFLQYQKRYIGGLCGPRAFATESAVNLPTSAQACCLQSTERHRAPCLNWHSDCAFEAICSMAFKRGAVIDRIPHYKNENRDIRK
jgi:hypothetical protein